MAAAAPLAGKAAMVLAAGLGTRLCPFTETLPKPLLPLFDVPLIEFALVRLKAAGAEDIVVNTYHCPEPLEEYLATRSRALGLPIRLSREQTLLGTGGGIALARRWFAGRPVLVVNSDILALHEVADLVAFHESRASLFTALLHSGEGHEGLRSTAVDEAGRITAISPASAEFADRSVFAGSYLMEPAAYALLEPQFSSVITAAVRPLMATGQAYGLRARFPWRDLGTWPAVLESCREILAEPAGPLRKAVAALSPGRFGQGPDGSFYIGPEVTAHRADVGPGAVLCRGAVVEAGCRVANALVLPGCRVAAPTAGKVVLAGGLHLPD